MVQFEVQQPVQTPRHVLNRPAFSSRALRAPDTERLHIMVIAADPLFRAALCWTLLGCRPDGDISEVSRLSDAVDALRRETRCLVLLDDGLLEDGGPETLKALKALFSGSIVILSSDTSGSAARRAMDYGACGYIARSSSLEEMTATLCKLVEQAARRQTRRPLRDENSSPNADSALTPAQARVLALVEVGQLNKQIAHRMGIAESTVKAHVTAIFRKLNVQNRVQAIRAVIQQRSAATMSAMP